TSSSITASDNKLIVDNDFLKITWDLANGGAIQNIVAIHKDFSGTPVAREGIKSTRSGGGMPTIETVMWDIITTGDPWYGLAIGASANYEVLEETENYTLLRITYSLPDPLSGLKVVKTYRVWNASFIIEFNMTLINEGGSQIVLNLSDAWGRPVGPMVELVAKIGEPDNDMRFVWLTDNNITTVPRGASGIDFQAFDYHGMVKGVGIYDASTEPSPWGFMLGLFMVDNETIGKTSHVWFESTTGGVPDSSIRIEFRAVTIDPGSSEEYHMLIYAGPLHYYYIKQLGMPSDLYNKNFYSPDYSPRIPCKVVTVELKYDVNVEIVTEGGKGIPKSTILLFDVYTGDLYNQVEIKSDKFVLKIPYTNTTYRLKIDPETGVTIDGLGEFRFEGWILPNGTLVESPEVNITLSQGDTVKLKFSIRELAKIILLFVTPDGVGLPQQAGDINFTVYTDAGELVYSDTSKPESRNITVVDLRFSPPKPGLKTPGTYLIEVPVKAGIYSLDKILVNNKEVKFEVLDDYAQATITLEKGGIYEVQVIYSSGGFGGGLLVWIGVIAVLAVITIVFVMVKGEKK
ncbi:MAG: hypothetical protein B6U89_00465, partial [Desulfurococcales archaeon ex4484_58]